MTRNAAAIEESYFWFISRMQMIADMPTWLGAYEKAMADRTNDEARAVALADQAVIDSQGSGLIKDLARAQRGTPALKLFTQFMSYFSVVHNQGAESVAAARRSHSLAGAGRLATDLLLLYSVPMILELALRDAFRGEDEPEDEAFWARVAREQAAYVLNTIPFARELSGAVRGYQYTGPAGAGFFDQAAKLIVQMQQGELDDPALTALLRTGGTLLHFPAIQVERMVRSAIAAEKDGARAAFHALFGGKKAS